MFFLATYMKYEKRAKWNNDNEGYNHTIAEKNIFFSNIMFYKTTIVILCMWK